ncbi:PAQR family membrane homeostasis protein TrhA [Paludisphaera rhizosphaerae]|uniref:PAQR family membrane homeostasis protein TrhA n=1 Tax=Paludisphaera rhizosphaerae TaxID=2711216 RepID=UPI0013EAC265|nr:hemolysin III family protein [Paludisphaera rhizosphaerae]
MSPISLREPVSAWTHALGLFAAFPVTWLLVREAVRGRSAGDDFDGGKVAALGVFGFGMAACYGASTVYHALPADAATIALLRRLDMVGIFLLIAGTFTPCAWTLMRPRPRRTAMAVVWGVSLVCGSAVGLGRSFPTWLATLVYVSLGWGMLACYLEVRRHHDPRRLRLLPAGGVVYTAGAAVNLFHFPEFLPGVGPHEVFHVLVLAGTATHVAFLSRVVAPAMSPSAPAQPLHVESAVRATRLPRLRRKVARRAG